MHKTKLGHEYALVVSLCEREDWNAHDSRLEDDLAGRELHMREGYDVRGAAEEGVPLGHRRTLLSQLVRGHGL
jgi:hypothetical protein